MKDARVLIADDDDDLRALIREGLVEAGADVEEADSGVALMQRLGEAGPFDLVITDVRMSWASGIQVLAMARLAGCETPFLVITAYESDEVRRAATALGAPVLQKPFELERLIEQARRLTPRRSGGLRREATRAMAPVEAAAGRLFEPADG